MKKNIVVVDDQAPILRLIINILKSMRFEVFDFSDPQTAIEVMENSDIKVHLLVTDFNMPEMNGSELAKKFKQLYPGIKVVCVSGFPSKEKEMGENNFFLKKPFSVKAFREKIKEALLS